MAYISNKSRNMVPVNFSPIGGLNLALPPHAIADNEMQQANNVIYLPNNGQLAVRPGFSCMTQSAASGAILNMHQFKDKVICSVSDGKVYVYDVAADTFTSIHDIGAVAVAAFMTFNNLVLIADGAGLYSWDGTATDTTEITTLLHPTTIFEIGNRVVINDGQDLDAVWFSGPEDENDWETGTGAAVMVRAGFGDGMNVNGYSVIGTDLIVSKSGNGKRFIYRINTSGDPKSWSVHKLITDTSADNEFTIESVPNQVLYINEDGELRSLEGVQEYGDIQMMNAGEKINPMLTRAKEQGLTPSMIRYSPIYDMLIIIFSGVVGLYSHASRRFTTTSFDSGDLRCCCDYQNTLLWGSHTGNIYLWNESSDMDEPSAGDLEVFESNMKSKVFSFPGESLVKKTGISFSNFIEGNGTIRINHKKMLDFEILGLPWYLFDADDTQLADADMLLYERGEADSVIKSRNRCRQKDFFIHITVLDGRAGFNYIEAMVAQVNG